MSYIFTLATIGEAARKIIAAYNTQKIFALHGSMGAGKTTLINAICKALGVTEHTSSPTYGIIAEYNGVYNNLPVKICHMDWYRLRGAAEAIDAGVVEYLHNPSYYCFVEWPSIAPSLLPANTLHLEIKILSEQDREVVVVV
jgi:tRNA threonylcarbamoyladenosine biosynthesis protein TsaE